MHKTLSCLCAALLLVQNSAQADDYDAVAKVKAEIGKFEVGAKDWPQWAGSPLRNNVTDQPNVPIDWNVQTGENIRWSMPLGSETYGNPVIANGQVYVGTNNGAAYLDKYPETVDLGCLMCFAEKDGKFLWQHSSKKLPQGRVHDWPDQGICSTAMVDGDRLWYVSSRGEVVCLDTAGFHDDENDGVQNEEDQGGNNADVVWSYNMMLEIDVRQHNMCSCSVTCAGELLFVNTSNGVDEGHESLPAEDAPSFICLNRNTGKLIWSDSNPGKNVVHGQWSSPTYAVLGGVPQVLFGGGDGWLYSFDPAGEAGKSKLLWKFDCNPKKTYYELFGATRNHIIATPVVYDGLVYIAVGEDPDHGEGIGHLWCIDPSKRGDVSPTIVYNGDPANPTAVPHKRLQAMVEKDGDFERDNPNSAAVWHYIGSNTEEYETTMHRTLGSVAIKDDLLFIADQSGVFHCLDAKTGKDHWTHDMFSASWATPAIVEDRVYISDEDGYVRIYKFAKEMEIIAEVEMNNSVFTSPVVANSTLFISNRNRIFAIEKGAQSEPEE